MSHRDADILLESTNRLPDRMHDDSSKGSPQEIRQANAAKAVAVGLLAWMFLPLVTGRVYVWDDLQNYHLPIRHFYAQCLANGDSFDWMPNLFSGFFLTGSGQAGTYHPLHLILYRFFPLTTAFNLEIVLSYPFMLFGMQLCLRRHLIRNDAAWLGAIVFTFSGFCTLHFLHPNAIAVVAHIPWLLLVQDVLLRPDAGPRRWRVPAEVSIAMLTGSQLLLGYPQYVWFSLLAEASLCIGLCGWNWKRLRILLLIGLLKCFGFALGAVQLLPSMAALAESDRTSLPPEFFFQHPLSLVEMLQWIGPFLTKYRVFGPNTHELGVYCGAIPVLLALTLIGRRRSKLVTRSDAGTRLLIPMLGLGVLALWLSFGRSGGLYVIQTWLPLIGKFRYPSRSVVLIHFVLAVLAAMGYARLMYDSAVHEVRLPRLISIVPWLSAAAAVGAWFLGTPEDRAPWTMAIAGPFFYFLAAWILKDIARGRVSLGFMIFLAGDLAAYGFTYEAMKTTETWAEVMGSLNQPPGAPNDGRIVAEIQIADGDISYEGNDLLLAGWHQADGYEGLLPKTYLLDQYTSLDSLRISGVRWINSGGAHSQIYGLKQTNNPHWLEVPDPSPRVRLTSNTTTITDLRDAVRYLDPDGATVVDRDPDFPRRPFTSTETSPGTATITFDRPGQIEIQTSANSPRLLVISERFSEGWKANADGLSLTILRAEIDFMGCVVPAGVQTIRFSFEHPSVRDGRRISGITLVLLCLYVLGRFVQRS